MGHIEQEGGFFSRVECEVEETSEWTQATFFLINAGDPLKHMYIVIRIRIISLHEP